MLTGLQYRILKWISPGAPDCCNGCVYEGTSKLAALMGDDFFTKIAGKVVIDFGCGEGAEAVEMFEHFADPAEVLRIIIWILRRDSG